MKCLTHQVVVSKIKEQQLVPSSCKPSFLAAKFQNAHRHSNHTFRGAACLALLLCSSVTTALGLGDIEPQFYLGQPVAAKIKLVNMTSDINVEDVFVRSVGFDEATQMGTDVNFGPHILEVALINDPYPHISLTSTKPVNEPYVSVLLELSWPTGMVFREYTILIDPPAEVATPETSRRQTDDISILNFNSTQQRYTNNPAYRNAPTATDNNSTTHKLNTSENNYRVKVGDNLTIIAARWRESSNQSLDKINTWIFENNPHAFINNNINALKAGAILTLPNPSITRFANEPVPDIAEINKVISDENEVPATNAELAQGVLSLRQGNVDDQIKELIDALTRENESLRARITTLEDSEYLNTMQELVALQQQQIEMLQARLRENTRESENGLQTNTAEISKTNTVVAPTTDSQVQPNTLLEVDSGGVEAIVAKATEETPYLQRIRSPAFLFIAGLILATLAGIFIFLHKLLRKPLSDRKNGKETFAQATDSDETDDSIAVTDSDCYEDPAILSVVKTENDTSLNDNVGVGPWRPRRSDAEVHASIAKKMATYDPEDFHNHDALSSLEIDEIAQLDDIDTIAFLAMMFAHSNQFDKARSFLETKLESHDDERLHSAMSRINILQVEAERKHAS